MLMAAGLGTRLRPFTLSCTKALVPILGVPVAQFALDLAVKAGVKRCVANVHHLAEQARTGLLALDRMGTALEISDESSLLLGSAGGYRKALPRLGAGPFFALNADVLSDVDLGALFNAHLRLRRRHGVLLTLAVFREAPPGEKYRRIVVDEESGLVTKVVMEPEERPPFWASVAVVEPEALSGVPEGVPSEFVPAVLLPAIERGKVGAFVTSGHWYDVGSPDLWLRAQLALIQGLEDGRIPAAWRQRIEKVSRRIASGQWVSAGARSSSDWAGPCFWDGKGLAPKTLGPEAVLYGELPQGDSGRQGIGFAGTWVGVRTLLSPDLSQN